jgi:hypothetical protein
MTSAPMHGARDRRAVEAEDDGVDAPDGHDQRFRCGARNLAEQPADDRARGRGSVPGVSSICAQRIGRIVGVVDRVFRFGEVECAFQLGMSGNAGVGLRDDDTGALGPGPCLVGADALHRPSRRKAVVIFRPTREPEDRIADDGLGCGAFRAGIDDDRHSDVRHARDQIEPPCQLGGHRIERRRRNRAEHARELQHQELRQVRIERLKRELVRPQECREPVSLGGNIWRLRIFKREADHARREASFCRVLGQARGNPEHFHG